MGKAHAWFVVAVTLTLTISACGEGLVQVGSDQLGLTDTTDSETPAPTSATTTGTDTTVTTSTTLTTAADAPEGVSGAVTLDGEPVVDETVALYAHTPTDTEEEPDPLFEVQTDANGHYVFTGLKPGTYVVVVTVLVWGVEMADTFGLAWDDPCTVEGRLLTLNARVVNDATGQKGVIATAEAGEDEGVFEYRAGDRLVRDYAFTCS